MKKTSTQSLHLWRPILGMLIAIYSASPSKADMCTGSSAGNMNFAGSLSYTGNDDSLLNDNLFSYSNYGGVSLNKTLTLLNNVDNIVGAAYDPKKGEIVFVGAGTVAETIDYDDLVVAARTVFSVDAQGFSVDPGVSFDSAADAHYLYDGKAEVRFTGATRNTAFGQILFDADYALKRLGQGVDSNGNLLRSNSAFSSLGYISAAERYIVNAIDYGNKTVQFWITPSNITLQAVSDPNTGTKSFVFTGIAMQVCVRVYNSDGSIDFADSCAAGAVASTPLQQKAVDFANNITANYDAYAAIPGFEAMKKLKRLGKIVGIIRWIRDNNIPIDLSFMDGYVPKNVNTPEYVKLLQLCKSPTSNAVVAQGSGPYVPGSCVEKIIGGVKYDRENTQQTGSTQSQMITDALANAGRLLNPQSATDMTWNFSSGGTSYKAYSQTVAPSGKDGNFSFNSVDLSYPNQAGQTLSFTRYYDSFSGINSRFGPGWSEYPYSLIFRERHELTDGSLL